MWKNWHYIPGFDNYEFNWHTNEVRNIKRMKKIKVHETRWIVRVCLSKWKLKYTFCLGRITLLITQWPKPEWLMCCHNDWNQWNNFPDNVRYDTVQSNAEDMIKHKSHRLKMKKVKRSDWKIFDSIADAWRSVWKDYHNILRACRWRRPTAYGYRWEYIS